MNGYHPSRVEIDINRLQLNISIVRNFIGKSLYCLPVKANAYGHGLEKIAKASLEAGVDFLAVACLQEGVLLRKAGIESPIIVFGAFHENQIEDLIRYDLQFSISSQLKARWVKEVCEKIGKTCQVHIEVDTGIQRTGVRPATALFLLEYIYSSPVFEPVGIYSHFATGDGPGHPFVYHQIELFNELKRHPDLVDKKLIWHLANSGGTAYYPESHFDMVRPSLLTFGYLMDELPSALSGIAPCFSLKSHVSYFKVVEKGKGISYDHTYTTEKESRIVTVPVGYGDGYPRALSNKAEVLIRGKRYKIAGTICMDQFMVDIGNDEVFVGDEVVLIGTQGEEQITAKHLATLCDTNPREILCLLNNRLPRKFSP